MSKKPRPDITRIQAEGTTAEKLYDKHYTQAEAEKLASKMPTFLPDKQVYIRNLLTQTLAGRLDKDVFKYFIKLTNSYQELEASHSRALLLLKKQRR